METTRILSAKDIGKIIREKRKGSSRFSVGLSSDRRDGDELNQREEIVFIPVSISNSLSNLYPVVEAFKLAS